MIALERRISRALQRYGEPYSVGAQSRVGVFSVALGGRVNALVGGATADSLTRPAWLALVPAADTTAQGATLTWRGNNYLVQRATDIRVAATTVARLLLISPSIPPPGPV